MHVIIDGVKNKGSDQHSEPDFWKNFAIRWAAVFPEDRLSVITNNEGPAVAIPQVEIYNVAAKKTSFNRNKIFGQALPSLASELKADIFISSYLNTSAKISIPQVLDIWSDFTPAVNNLPVPKRWLYTARLRKQISNADHIIFPSFFLKERVNNFIQLPEEKTTVIYQGIQQQASVADSCNQQTKEKYTSGREYFLYCGKISENQAIINMLKGFSAFKKRQQTNMMLMFAGTGPVNTKFQELINTYKYRDSILITDELNDEGLQSVRSAAYAALFPLLGEGSEAEIIASAASGVPVLCADTPAYRKLDITSALYFDPDRPEDINTQMAFIYKNENKRREMVQLGSTAGTKFSWTAGVARYREIFRKLL